MPVGVGRICLGEDLLLKRARERGQADYSFVTCKTQSFMPVTALQVDMDSMCVVCTVKLRKT